MFSASFFSSQSLLLLDAAGTDRLLCFPYKSHVIVRCPCNGWEITQRRGGEGCSGPPSTPRKQGFPQPLLRERWPCTVSPLLVLPAPLLQAAPKAANEQGARVFLLVLLEHPQPQLEAPAVGISCHGNLADALFKQRLPKAQLKSIPPPKEHHAENAPASPYGILWAPAMLI